MEKLKTLEKQRNELDLQIREIQDRELEEKLIPVLKSNIGNCYVFVNSYGGDSKKWNLYNRVIGVTEDANYIIDSFQNCSDGRIEIETSKVRHNYRGKDSFRDSGYKPITIEEYQAAQKALLKIVKKVLI